MILVYDCIIFFERQDETYQGYPLKTPGSYGYIFPL